MNYLITIIGPTAIGKTALSISLAKHFNCDIISCDSRQFFKEMNIGTAVPSKVELASAKHHFIQNKSIFEPYTVGHFEKEVIAKLDELFKENPIQILVGGSGLYVDAVLKGYDEFPEIQSNVRTQVQLNYEQFGLSYLQENLKTLDANYYNFLSKTNPQTLQNPQRMMRFVEVCLGSGMPYSFFLNKEKVSRNFTPILIGIEADRSIIYKRINERVEAMMQNGLLDEVKNLLPYQNLNALQTVGYSELFQFFEGKISLETAVEEIKKNTRRFSKRQLTWFKRLENVTWFDYLSDIQLILNEITSNMKIT
ncbi:MAG: tRNA (adenosine(37)-N6)-dimethylallyltransferase MiaA [Flavobacterium sp.]|nr:tRNA (adenosine(37)-N6)-dimethylallyltransferase MiaA [Flavobacterium sp.]